MSAEETGAPNLDAMPRSELVTWAGTTEANLSAVAKQMFPERRQVPREKYTRLLIDYARAKAAAMATREDGIISTALGIERQCEEIYNRLPKYARW